jgi:hypothetical protein
VREKAFALIVVGGGNCTRTLDRGARAERLVDGDAMSGKSGSAIQSPSMFAVVNGPLDQMTGQCRATRASSAVPSPLSGLL